MFISIYRYTYFHDLIAEHYDHTDFEQHHVRIG